MYLPWGHCHTTTIGFTVNEVVSVNPCWFYLVRSALGNVVMDYFIC